MSKKQLDRYDIISKTNAGYITVKEAAEALGLSQRQVQRLKKKVREMGAAGVIHKNSFHSPANKLPAEVVQEIIRLKKTELYQDANFNHFRELLAEHHGIELSYASLYQHLKQADIHSPKTRRRFKVHRRRKRRSQAGMLLQVDATPFAWFKGDRKQYSLHGAIDDATGQITSLYLCKNECLHGYFEMLRRTIENYGIPVSIYADRHTIFQSPNREKALIDSKIKVNDTQLGRALKELSVGLIAARTPQAKGRVERLWQTLQGRLPIEFALRDINTIDDANHFLSTYIYLFNSEFAVEPEGTQSMFAAKEKTQNLDDILCVKEKRTIDSGGVFSYGGKSFKVHETVDVGIIPPHTRVNILVSSAFGLKVEYRNIFFDVLPFVPPKPVRTKKAELPKVPRPVPLTHYYKYGQALAPKLDFTESREQVLSMLNELFLRPYA